MKNSIWLPNGSASLANGELSYDNSTRTGHKRGHRWFLNNSDQHLLFNKKQAVESSNGTPGPVVVESSLWHGGSSFQPDGQRGYRPYGPKPVQSPIVSASFNMENKSFENQFRNDSSLCLSMSHAAEDPLFHKTGLRKFKANEVTVPVNRLPQLVGDNIYFAGEKNKIISTSSSNTFQMTGNKNTTDGNDFFDSARQASCKTAGPFVLTNQSFNGIDNNFLSLDQTNNRVNYNMNFNDDNFMSIGPTYGKARDSYLASHRFYSKVNKPLMRGSSAYKADDSDVIPYTIESSNMGDHTITTTCFGGLISSYGPLLNQSSGQPIVTSRHKDSAVQQSGNETSAATSKAVGSKKSREAKMKKGSLNNFPSNVKSLLSTGIFDGVPVKYVSWSREKNLRGLIKGKRYLCSCQDCKLAKSVNAYEFERHAECKTKHPNNHIYFENGKTIYAVVQELKGIPTEMLFEVLENVTGSTVNQKNFSTWKESYQAASRVNSS